MHIRTEYDLYHSNLRVIFVENVILFYVLKIKKIKIYTNLFTKFITA